MGVSKERKRWSLGESLMVVRSAMSSASLICMVEGEEERGEDRQASNEGKREKLPRTRENNINGDWRIMLVYFLIKARAFSLLIRPKYFLNCL